jgi:EF-P beta-lysylation protein EpmB
VHCRYCFRRHFPYDDNVLTDAAWTQAVAHLAADASIQEVILSGGDPLSLSNDKLRAIGARLAAIPHLRRLRIHTRMPVVLPERVDAGLLAWLAGLPWQTVVVLHSNHAREIDAPVRAALRALAGGGATLLNQAVLLRGVNDSVAALRELSETLFAAGVLPYYLHLLDKVAGAAHFEVPENEALTLMATLQGQLPGYLVPRLVREDAGATAKTPLAPASA